MIKKSSAPSAAQSLKLDFVNHQAAKYSVEKYHYSKTVPFGKAVRVGVWENDKFIGVVIFSRGSSQMIGRPYNLKQDEICELTRVALTKHITTVTKIVSIAIKLLKKTNPGIKLIVSYADPAEGHLGKIYQAGNWVYVGRAGSPEKIALFGKALLTRSIGMKYGTHALDWLRKNVDPNAYQVRIERKYKYLMPLDEGIKIEIEKLRQDYPRELALVA